MKSTQSLQSIRRFYLNKTEVERGLILSCLFSICLSIIRVILTSQLMFAWLQWNLFLAFLPYFITRTLIRRPRWIESRWKFAIAFLCWLAFIPNSFYIITDLVHLDERLPVPLWYDLALILSFVWNGLLLGALSVRQMEKIVVVKYQIPNEWWFSVPIMAVNAFGVYIGRYLRYNSWDLLSNPFGLFSDVAYLLMHPIRNRIDWGMIVCYALFMMLMYNSLKRVSKMLW